MPITKYLFGATAPPERLWEHGSPSTSWPWGPVAKPETREGRRYSIS
jgi:hypothetical protein